MSHYQQQGIDFVKRAKSIIAQYDKRVIITFILVFIISSVYSQNSNYEKGTTITVKVNGQLFDIDQYGIHVYYEKYMKGTGVRNISDWNMDFMTLLNNMKRCASKNSPFEFKVGSVSAQSIRSCDGLSNEERGITKKGKLARNKKSR